MTHERQSRRFHCVGVALAALFCSLSLAPAEPAPTRELAAAAPRNLLTKHEDEKFENQTVYISGQAFIRCKFIACTLVLRESPYHLQGCNFERCNWHVDCLITWGSDSMLREIKALVNLMEEAQQKQLPQAKP
jgi:hypothetical protein